MCGIAGWANLDPRVLPIEGDESILTAMCDRIGHRGPDSVGSWHGAGVAMQMRRLAIIDLSTGDQPVRSADGSIVAVLNGEIYNYRDIRRSLQAMGVNLRSAGDAEVLPYLYQLYGEDMLEHLNGMFAFALWDSNRRTLFIARDRMGEKPLYYGIFNKTLIFASELKALTSHPAVELSLNATALRQYLAYDYIPAPSTIYEHIYKLPAAHSLTLASGHVSVKRYWDVSFKKRQPMPTLDDATEELRDLIADSVKIRMASDVPLGVLLSGGVDSSTIAAFAQRYSEGPIKTFCIGFGESSFDESEHARRVAAYLGTEHFEDRLNAERAAELITEIAMWLDEPVADPSLVPTFLLSRLARTHVTVALGGEGGDEVFAGYPTYFAHKLAERYEQIPRVVRRNVIEQTINRLPVSDKSNSFGFMAKRFIKSFAFRDLVERHHSLLGSFVKNDQETLLTNDLKSRDGADIYGESRRWLELCDAQNVIEKAQFLDMKLYLADDILTKVDRASMAVSLEVRAPFLDPRIVEFAAGVSEYYKLHCKTIKFGFGRTGKYILKRAVNDMLPPGVTGRLKKGFEPPINAWLKGRMNGLMRDLLAEDRLRRQGLFHPEFVTRLMSEHQQGRVDNGKMLWALVVFQLWYDNFYQGNQRAMAAASNLKR